jgi:hypothetical protein
MSRRALPLSRKAPGMSRRAPGMSRRALPLSRRATKEGLAGLWSSHLDFRVSRRAPGMSRRAPPLSRSRLPLKLEPRARPPDCHRPVAERPAVRDARVGAGCCPGAGVRLAPSALGAAGLGRRLPLPQTGRRRAAGGAHPTYQIMTLILLWRYLATALAGRGGPWL